MAYSVPVRHFSLCLLALLLASACGTAVFEHQIDVTVSDPSGRLGAGRAEVSVFDKQMGQSSEWARRTMGTARAGAPYAGRVSSTGAKMIFDSSLPERLEAGLALPSYESRGYFVLSFAPQPGTEQQVSAPFVPWGAYFAEGSAVAPLPLKARCEKGEKGWKIALTVEVPAGPR